MIQSLIKHRKKAAYLLLLSFLNIMTFLPVSHIDNDRQEITHPVLKSTLVSSYDPDYKDPSTLLELFLENVAGLKDNFPDHEQPDLNSHFFNQKSRINTCIFQSFILPANTPAIDPVFIASEDLQKVSYAQSLPHLQHHNYLFRLTPF